MQRLTTTWVSSLAGNVVLAASLGACANVDSGVVELNWAFVDRDGDAIFPAGQFSAGRGDACDQPGRIGADEVSVDLEVQLDICDSDCAGSCDGDCQIVPPERAGCDAYRTTITDVPASARPYLFLLRAIVVTPTGDCVAPSGCFAVPGPRERTVTRGLVTDLQVLQIVVDVDTEGDDVLDLEACGCA